MSVPELNDLRIIAGSFIIFLVLFTLLTAGLAHCDEASLKSSQVLLSLYIKSKNRFLPDDIRDFIAEQIVIQSDIAGISYEVIAAIACVESHYDPAAVGPCGEIGLMQIYTLECAGYKINKDNLFFIEYNVMCGICILREKLKECNGNLIKAIERYNGSGPGAEEFREKVCLTIVDIFRFRIAQNSKPVEALPGKDS